MPVKQHPVPQHISSYEFRLIGDMTLKQFGYLAGGAVLALIFYSLPMPVFFKWPLVTLFAFAGFATAFLPIEERPLTTWVTAFLKAAFSPTLFVWQKKEEKPDILAPVIHAPKTVKILSVAADKAGLTEYLKTLPEKTPVVQIDQQEKNSLANIDKLFQTAPAPQIMPKPLITPTPQPVIPPVSPQPIKPVIQPPIRIKPPAKISFVPPIKTVPRPVSVAATTGLHLPFPEPPSRPNLIAGMVLDQAGQIIEGTILEIRDSQGFPVRALKSNKLGQFAIATPLRNGQYEIETEKEGFKFDIIKIEAQGEIIKPIEIRAK